MSDIDEFLESEVPTQPVKWPKYVIIACLIISISLLFVDISLASKAWIITLTWLANVGILFMFLEFMDPEVTFNHVFIASLLIGLASGALYLLSMGSIFYIFLWFGFIWPIYKIFFPKLTFWKIIAVGMVQSVVGYTIRFVVEIILL